LLVKSPSYKSRNFDDVLYLDASAALNDRTLVMNIVNRHRNESVNAEIALEDRQFAGPVEVSEVNAPDIKAENSFESTAVRTVQRSTRADKNLLRYTFPAHSYTMLKATLA
jgi:alpha-L-arabinofuranosidase